MRIKRYIISSLVCVVCLPSAKAQRIVSELESNSDGMMMQKGDTTSTKKSKKIVPNDVRAWTVDEVYGNITPTYVDTLTHLFMNDNLTEGRTGHYNSLANLGTPRLSRIYTERADLPLFIFTSPYDQFFVTTDRFRFYNTKSPYMNITYNCCGSKQTGDDHVKCIYTNNAGKDFNFGGIFDYIYGQGFYDSQSTSFMNATAWADYIGERYNFHFYYQHNFMKQAENGGIKDERDITHPEEQARTYASNDIPVFLSKTWNRQEHDVAFFNHHYNLGFYRREYNDSIPADSVHPARLDSTKYTSTFVPVSKVFHTFKLEKMRRNYRAYEETEGYHTNTYLPGDSTEDVTKHFYMKNLVGVSLCEGFNKWAAFGINAYVGHEMMQYQLIDTMQVASSISALTYNRKYKEHNLFFGGQMIREQGTMFHYNVDAMYYFSGADAGDFEVSGHGEMNFTFMKDTAQLAVNAFVKRIAPSFYFSHYHSKHAWWDQDVEAEIRQHLEGVVSNPSTNTVLSVSLDNIKNYTYFENNGTANEDGSYSNNVVVRQCGSNIQVLTAKLEQNFKFGILHFDNEIIYQTTSDKRSLPLPALSTYNNLYLQFKIAKVLRTQVGADMKYFTEYYAPDYSPVIGMFTVQNSQKYVNIGNYPLVSLYANFALKRSRFYLQYYHANQSTGRYFWAPGYPMNPTTLRFGISWNFYD